MGIFFKTNSSLVQDYSSLFQFRREIFATHLCWWQDIGNTFLNSESTVATSRCCYSDIHICWAALAAWKAAERDQPFSTSWVAIDPETTPASTSTSIPPWSSATFRELDIGTLQISKRILSKYHLRGIEEFNKVIAFVSLFWVSSRSSFKRTQFVSIDMWQWK